MQTFAGAVGFADAIALLQGQLDGRNFRQRAPLAGGERNHIVIVAGDGHSPLAVFHGCQQLRQTKGGVRSPVAVVAAVEVLGGAVGGQVQGHDAARAEEHRRAPALVHGAVGDD